MQAKVDGMDVSSNIVRETTSQPFIWSIHSSDNAFSLKIPCCGEAMAEHYLLLKPLPIGHQKNMSEIKKLKGQNRQRSGLHTLVYCIRVRLYGSKLLTMPASLEYKNKDELIQFIVLEMESKEPDATDNVLESYLNSAFM